jgi:hypothetical protein
MRRFLSTVLLIAFTSSALHAQTNPGHHRELRRRTGLILAGTFVFLAGYIPAVAIAAGSSMGGTTGLGLLPVAGPLIIGFDDATDSRHCPLRMEGNDCHSTFYFHLYFVMGLAQLAGATMFGVGFIKRNVWVKDVAFLPPPQVGFAVRF